MLIGNPAKLAIESEITRSMRVAADLILPSGYFVLHVGGLRYGIREPDATLLGCSVDEVERRIARRGTHTVSFSSASAGALADAYRDAIYAPDQEDKRFFEIAHAEFEALLYASHVCWAPDGDEAFDDGSYVLQCDVGDRVRIVAFKIAKYGYHHEPTTLRDVWLDADQFYGVLNEWLRAFTINWDRLRGTENANDTPP